MITKEIALVTSMFYHKTRRNKDGTAVRARCNGKVKTWKTRPNDFQVPVKYGLRQCFYIHNQDWGMGGSNFWLPYDPTEEGAKERWQKAWLARQRADIVKLDPNTPPEIINDKWAEDGWQEVEDAVKKAVPRVWAEIQYDAGELEGRCGLEDAVELCLDASRPCQHGMPQSLYDKLLLLPADMVDGWVREVLKGYFI